MLSRFNLCFFILSFSIVLISHPVFSADGLERRLPSGSNGIMLSFAPVVQKTTFSVVNVYATRMVMSRRYNPFEEHPFFRHFFGGRGFGLPRERVQASLGSGVLVSADGIVVTNDHVVADATGIEVAFADRRTFAAKVIVRDERTDLAVLRIHDEKESFPFLPLGDSDDLQVGDIVLAIGNPFGVGQTVTSGIVSALARSGVGVTDYQSFIQTDAPINPGNSGGPLVDMQGQLIGINTAIFSRSGGSQGIGFSIPSNMVRLVVKSAINDGVVRRPWLGARIQAVTLDIAQSLGLDRPLGVLVNDVLDDSPAARAGLKTGDLITGVAGRDITDLDNFLYRFSTQGIGGQVDLLVIRNNRKKSMMISLEPAPEIPPRDETILEGAHPLDGARVVNFSPAIAEEFRIDWIEAGVVVSDVTPGSSAAHIGLMRGDIILDVNDKRIKGVRMLVQLLNPSVRRWRLLIDRNGKKFSMVLGLRD